MHRSLTGVGTILLIIAVMAVTIPVPAQTATGDIAGIVTDVQGAVVIGAHVTAEETSIHRVRATITNDRGVFSFPLLPPDTYRITAVTLQMAESGTQLELLVGTHRQLNIVLNPESAFTTLHVTASSPSIETTSSEIQANITPQQMTSLPLFERTFASLAILAPGVRPTIGGVGPVSINGSTGRNFNLTVDGGEDKDNTMGGFLQNYTTEGIQEFAVKTYNFSADTGKSSGAVIEIVTRAGTNQFHGGAFFILRNRNLEATDYFTAHPFESFTCKRDPGQCYTGPANPKPGFDRQNYGGSLGGPILPDRWFFFGALERTHENRAIPQNGQTVATIKAFQILQAHGAIADPLLANAVLDSSSAVTQPFRDLQWQVRSEVSVNQKNQLSLRYSRQDNHRAHDGLDGLEDPGSAAPTSNSFQSLAVNHTFAASTHVLNQFIFQFSDYSNLAVPDPAGNAIPSVNFDNGVSFGQNTFVPNASFQRKFQFRDDVTWQKGLHLLKFGFQEAAVTLFGGRLVQFPTPTIELRCLPQEILQGGADPCGTGFAYNSLDQSGVVRRTRLASGDDSFFQPTINQISYYVQDDWRISSRLTLNLGVRNDIDFGLIPTNQNPRPESFAFCASCIGNRTLRLLRLLPAKSLNQFVPEIGLAPPHNGVNNYAPRLGFAWDVTGRGLWVVRGGYGLFFDQFFQEGQIASLQNAGASVYALSHDARSAPDPLNLAAIGLSSAVIAAGPFPVHFLADLPYGARGWFMDSHMKQPYSQSILLGTQLRLNNNVILSIDAVHVLGLHGYSQTEINPSLDATNDTRLLNPLLDPVFGCQDSSAASISCSARGALHRLARITRNGAANRSRYDGMMFSVRRQFSGWFQLDVSYLLARAYNYGGVGGAGDLLSFTQGTAPGLTPAQSAVRGLVQPQDFGYASDDERHRVVLDGIVNLPRRILLSCIVQLASARPYTIGAGDDINGDGVFNDFYSPRVTDNPVFDPLGEGDVRFAVRPNSLRGDPYFQADLRLQKNFKFAERFTISTFADLFNVFNRVNFGNQFVSEANGFGLAQPPVPVDTGLDGPAALNLPRKPVGLAGPPLEVQIGLRIRF